MGTLLLRLMAPAGTRAPTSRDSPDIAKSMNQAWEQVGHRVRATVSGCPRRKGTKVRMPANSCLSIPLVESRVFTSPVLWRCPRGAEPSSPGSTVANGSFASLSMLGSLW